MAMTIIYNPRYAAWHDFLLTLPQRMDREGEAVFEGRNLIKDFPAPDGSKVVVKRYKMPNFFQRIAYSFFVKGKAKRAFNNAQELARREINTPEAIAFIECRSCGWMGYSYLFTRYDDKAPIVDKLSMDENFDKPFATALASFFATLHERGIIHHDLNNTNVRYSQQADGSYVFSLIDINRMTCYEKDTQPPLKQCLKNLTLYGDICPMYKFIGHEYIRFRHLPEDTFKLLIDVKEAHDRHWHRKKRFSHLWHRIFH